MGYYTDFRLTMYKGEDCSEIVERESALYNQIGKAFTKMFVEDEDYFEQLTDEYWGANWKWYNYRNDMRRLSAQFPDVYFVLEGTGEEHDDIWQLDIYNGKECYRTAKIIYPDEQPLEWSEVPNE